MAKTNLNKKHINGNIPERFNGKLKDISIPTIISYIRYTCIVHIRNKDSEAALFFDNGKLFNVRLNDEININLLQEIENWKEGTFSFCEWKTDIETEAEFISDILFFAEKLKNNCILYLKNLNHSGELYINKGFITNAVFDKKEGIDAVKDFINETDGVIKMIKNNTKTGNFNLSFIDIKTKYIQTIKKTEPMNVKKLNESLEILKEDLGDALIASVIWTSSDGQSLASINPQPKAAALFNQVTQTVSKTLIDSGFPGLNNYYLFDLKNDSMALIMIFKDYQWGVLVNSKKVQLGLLLNVVMPKAKESFTEALKN